MNAGTTAARNGEFPSPPSFKRDIALKCASSLPACRRTASHCALPLKAVPSPAVFSLKESVEASVEMLFPQEQTEDAAQTAGPDATAGGGVFPGPPVQGGKNVQNSWVTICYVAPAHDPNPQTG